MPELLCQHGNPQKHDRVAFYDNEYGWTKIVLTSHRVRRYGAYYNCYGDDGFTGGVHLDFGTFIEQSSCNVCEVRMDRADIDQLDGSYIPKSLTPSPERDEELDRFRHRSEANSFINTSFYSNSSVATLDKSFTNSPEWDSYGTQLETPPSRRTCVLREPVEHVTNLDKVADLSLVLPLTSTPEPPRPVSVPRSRISEPRRLLPLEEDDDQTPNFLSRLNLFRKKGR